MKNWPSLSRMKNWFVLVWAKRPALWYGVAAAMWLSLAVLYMITSKGEWWNTLVIVADLINFVFNSHLVVKSFRDLRMTKAKVWMRIERGFSEILDYCEKYRIHHQVKGEKIGFLDEETLIQVMLAT